MFEGWSPHGTYNVIRTQYITVTSDITYDAIWELYTNASYTVTYNAGSGKFPGVGTQTRTETVQAGQRCTVDEIPKRDGHEFKGWKLGTTQVDPLYTRIVRNTEFIAIWDDDADYPDISYTIIYDPNGGWYNSIESHPLEVSVTRGIPSAKPETPTKEGYTFNGWSTNKDATSGVIAEWVHPIYPEEGQTYTYYATWASATESTDKTITITFQPNGGTFGEIFDYVLQDDGSAKKTVTMLSSSTYTLNMAAAPTITRTSYIFKGWEVAGTGITITDSYVTLTSSQVYTAVWQNYNEEAKEDEIPNYGRNYTVTFDANGGIYTNGADKKDVLCSLNGSVTPDEEPTRDAFIFAGWGTSAYSTTIVDPSTYKITGNFTFYALWALSSFGNPTSVVIVTNGGTYKNQTGNLNLVSTVGTSLKQFYTDMARKGYIFKRFDALRHLA